MTSFTDSVGSCLLEPKKGCDATEVDVAAPSGMIRPFSLP